MRPTRADLTPGFVTHQPSRVRSPDRESCLHCRVKQAPIRILAWLAGYVSPRCARFDAMRIEGLVIRGRRVWKQILVDPHDPIPPPDRQLTTCVFGAAFAGDPIDTALPASSAPTRTIP
jgi:hypothetical protein